MKIKIADKFELWPVDALVPYERNSRVHDADQVDGIAASIAEFGFVAPIIVDRNRNRIAAGHGRLLAARRLGMDRVPVVAVDHLTEAQFRAYVIADNKHTDNSRFDEAVLAAELTDLRADGFDLDPLGFTDEELAALLPDEDDEPAASPTTTDPDAVPDTPPAPTSAAGDLWRLGQHRVLCGDSTDQAQADTLLGDDLAVCLWTDPPYNVNYEGSAGKILNDHMADAEFGKFLRAVFENAAAHLVPGAPAYIAHADAGPMGIAFRREFMAAGFYLASCLIWRKNALVLGRSDYHWQHEPILYGWRQGAAHRWFGARDKTTVVELGEPAITVTADGAVQVCQGESTVLIRGEGITVERVRGSVFFEDKPARNSEHPTMKPVGLIERMLANSTNPGDMVLDLFGGSGSTLIACDRLKRIARVMELDPRFVDVIVQRWQNLTGRVARLDATGETFAEVAARRAATAPAAPRTVPAQAPAAAPILVAGQPFLQAANDDEFSARKRA
ncbi:MAG TPA: site-specific DNA-methyltransferase [Pseudoxanthomonas sp.]